MSPPLAPPLLSSVQPDAVPVSAPGRVAARYIIQLCHSSYTGATEGPFPGEEKQRERERGKERERDREREKEIETKERSTPSRQTVGAEG